MNEFLRPITGDSILDTPYADCTEEDKVKYGQWYDKLKWYMALH